MAAADEAELVHMVATAAAHDAGPIAFRYPRGEGVGIDMPEFGTPLPIGKGRILREGSQVALLSLGTRLAECLKAAEDLAAAGLSATVADARFAKPLDEATGPAPRPRARGAGHRRGGLGRRLRQPCRAAARRCAASSTGACAFARWCMPDVFLDQDRPEALYARAGLDAAGIVAKVFEALGRDNLGKDASLGLPKRA